MNVDSLDVCRYYFHVSLPDETQDLEEVETVVHPVEYVF